VCHNGHLESSYSTAGLAEARRKRADWQTFDGENGEAPCRDLSLQDRYGCDPQAHVCPFLGNRERKKQIDNSLQLVNNPSYDLDPLGAKGTNKPRVALGRNTFLCESIVSLLRSIQLHFAPLAGVLSDKVKSDLCGLISHIFQKLLKSKIGSGETRHSPSLLTRQNCWLLVAVSEQSVRITAYESRLRRSLKTRTWKTRRERTRIACRCLVLTTYVASTRTSPIVLLQPTDYTPQTPADAVKTDRLVYPVLHQRCGHPRRRKLVGD
jgi:hypothetical protein